MRRLKPIWQSLVSPLIAKPSISQTAKTIATLPATVEALDAVLFDRYLQNES
jgi:hypothetical protein